jgi:hypothetical protein
VTAVTPIMLALIKRGQAKAAEKVERVAEVAARAEATTQTKLAEIARVGVDTHTLVNSNMGVQLKLNAALSRRIADYTRNADDIAAADLAQLLYDEHLKKQAVVDAVTRKEKP